MEKRLLINEFSDLLLVVALWGTAIVDAFQGQQSQITSGRYDKSEVQLSGKTLWIVSVQQAERNRVLQGHYIQQLFISAKEEAMPVFTNKSVLSQKIIK